MFDLQLGGNLETIGDVRVEERHKTLLVERAAASPGAGLPDACSVTAVEQTVLQVHVAADRRSGRGEERLGVDELAAAGAAEAEWLLTFLFFFCFRFLCFVLFEVFYGL